MVAKFNPLVEESFPLEPYHQEALGSGGNPVIQVPGVEVFFVSAAVPDETPTSSRHVIRTGQMVTPEGAMPARLDVRMPPTNPWMRFVRFATGSEFAPARASITPTTPEEIVPDAGHSQVK